MSSLFTTAAIGVAFVFAACCSAKYALVTVFGVPDLSAKELVADSGGRISLPLIGEVEAAGRTSGELAAQIGQRLATRFVRDPRVSVNIIKAVSQRITIDGSVREPGLYPVQGRMTLMRAIATAKGATEFAQLDSVVVFRTVGTTNYAALYNLKMIRDGRYTDPEVFPRDVVVVGDSQARRFFKDLLQVLPTVAVLGSAAVR